MKPPQNIAPWLLVPVLFSLIALSAGAQTPPDGPPTLAPIQALQLHDGFTLTYTVTEEDVRSPELKAVQEKNIVRDYERMVTQGNCTQAVADRMIKIVLGGQRAPHPPKRYEVTLSAQAGNLLCLSRELSGKEYATDMQGVAHPLPLDTEVVLYDGHRTYDYSTQAQRMTIEKGWRGMRLAYLPGVGLPGVPLVKPSEENPQAAPASGGLACALPEMGWSNPSNPIVLYREGEVSAVGVGDALQVTRAAFTTEAGQPPSEEWRYTQPQRFQGVWIAGQARVLENQSFPDGRLSPTRVREFRLSRALDAPLAPAKFDIRAYLPPGTGIYEDSAFHFRYDPHGGDLETQRRTQTARQAANEAKERRFSQMIRADRSDHGNGSDGNALLKAALAQARAQRKNVFVDFHASWCGPCFLLHHFLNDPQVKPLIGANYVVLEEDVFEHGRNGWENPGAHALFQKYGGRNAIPFYAVLTPEGKKLADSIYGTETLGMPSDAAEEKFVLALFHRTAPRLTSADMAALKAALERNTALR